MLEYRDYIKYADQCIEIAEENSGDTTSPHWILFPSIILSWCAIEAFINGMLEDFAALPNDLFQLHERALLLEQKLSFIDSGDKAGQFTVQNTEYRKLEHKILFLIGKFGTSRKANVKDGVLWNDFQDFKKIRNALVHPRNETENVLEGLDLKKAYKCIDTAKAIIKLVSKNVWGKSMDF